MQPVSGNSAFSELVQTFVVAPKDNIPVIVVMPWFPPEMIYWSNYNSFSKDQTLEHQKCRSGAKL